MSGIKIKTLQQKTFEVDIEHTETVRALKEKIEEDKGMEFQADLLKLIYAGKILEDSQPLSKYKIQPSGFVVVMVSKSRPPPKPAAEESSEATTTSVEASTTAQETPTSQQPPEATATTSESEGGVSRMETSEATPTVTPSAQGSDTIESRSEGSLLQAGSTLVTGPDLDEATSNLMALGYEQDQVIRALNASFNNPDRAAELLMTGNVPNDPIPTAPEGMEEEPGEQPSRDIPPGQQGEGESAGGPPPANPFEFLQDRPQFQLLRTLVQQNPGSLPNLLQQIGQANPQLLQLVSSNQQAFIDMLNRPSPGEGVGAGPVAGAGAGAPPQIPQGLSPQIPQGLPPGAVSIQVTPEEKEAIERLKGLGFAESAVIQAFVACDKNEELAANFLLSENDRD
ncbi:UV excision repair protein RAD23 homolog A-like [Halichondria panicea]|uniref:UV excision repair protein RAD23 homolog A-like n=1 Tax=Halichondria panicea TaxID=6063 RepID=UPI00312B8516